MPKRPGRRCSRLIGCFFLFAAVAAPAIPAVAQQAASVDVFIPPDHLLRRQLDEAQEAIDGQRYNDAVRLLGELLVGESSPPLDATTEAPPANIEDYFIEPAQQGSAQRSLKAEARQMLAGLPKRGLDAFDLLYGREAELLLQKALRDGDVDELNEVVRKYFYTEAGYQAAMLLGRHHLAAGRPLAAALALKQLYALPAGKSFEPDLSLLLAASWMLADSPQRAEKVLLALRDAQGNEPLHVGAAKVPMFREDAEALRWLRNTLGHIDLADGKGAEQWLVYRGNAARNAPMQGGTPLGQVRWAIPTPNDLKKQSAIMAEQQQYIKQQIPALPAPQPLVVRHAAAGTDDKDAGWRDVVLTRTPSRLLAVDFDTGQRIWFYPPWGQELKTSEATSFATPQSSADTPELLKLKQRTWRDAPYGQLSTDGTNVYFLHELGLADRVGPTRIVAAGGIIRRNPDSPRPYNQLMALELEREGYQVWTLGGENGGDEPRLAGAFFLGPPLPLMDRLYAIAEVKGDIRLVVLDPATGALQWQQQLCGVDSQGILDDSVRRLGGATPSFSDGVLVCPTSAGAVVAVDVAKRSLLWGYQYLSVPKERRVNGAFLPRRNRSRSSKQPGEAWADATITIADNKVLITPVEHDEIICLDLLNGTLPDEETGKDKPLWRRPRGEGLYVACVHDGNAVIVEKDAVVAVDMKTGEQAWEALIPDAPKTMPSGRGFQSGDAYFLPLTSSELAKIDLDGGKLLDVTPTRGTLGNLVCYRDTVISQGTTELASFYQREALGRIVAERLKENPQDAWALARRAELLLKDGRRSEALAALRKSYDLEPDDGTKSLLVNTLLGALEDDFAANQQLAKEVESLIDRPDQRADFLRLMAVGLQDIGKYQDSFDFYLKIVDEDALDWSAAPVEGTTLYEVAENLQVRNERWLRARLADLLGAVEAPQRKQMDEAIRQRLDQVLKAESLSAMRQFIEFFGHHPAAAEARLELAGRLWNAGELLEAELLLTDLSQSDEKSIAAAAAAQLARLLSDAGHVEEAAIAYQRLGREYAEVDCGGGKTGAAVLKELPSESFVAKALQELSGGAAWPQGRVEVTHFDDDDHDGPELGYSSYQRVYPSQVERVRGVLPRGMQLVLDRQRRIILRDGLGQQGVSVQLNGSRTSRYYTSNYSVTHAKMTGHLALVALGYELFAVDLLRSSSNGGRRLLWRKELSSPVIDDRSKSRQHAVPKLRGKPAGGHEYFAGDSDGKPIAGFTAANGQGVVYRRWRQLVCFDPLRPEVIHWVRDGIEEGAAVFGDDEAVVVVYPNASKAHLYSAVDGRALGECQLGEANATWATFGRKILRWSESENGVTVAMIDPWDSAEGAIRKDATLWSHKFVADSKGAQVERDEIAVLQPDGKLSLIELKNGNLRWQTQLEPETELSSLHVLRGQERYIVVANRPIDDAPAGATVQPVPGGYGPQGQYSPLVKGRVYALDADSGKSLWPIPAVVEHFGLPLDQPTHLPMVAFMRNVSTDTGSPSRSWKTEIVCLDQRDGRIVFHKDDIQGNTQVYRIEGDPQEKTAAIMLPNESFVIRWTDKPRPPAPPAQISSATEK